MAILSKSFWQGLRMVAPLAITVCVVYWVGALLEAMLGRWLRMLLPDLPWLSWRGSSAALGLVAIFFLGLLFYFPIVRTVFLLLEKGAERIPVIRTIYGSSKDLVQYFADAGAGSRQKRFSKVVLVTLGGNSSKVLGFVTQDNPSCLPAGLNQNDGVLVYLPMSYQIGGYTVLVPKNRIEPVEMSVEEAMRFSMTAGVSGNGRRTS